MPEQFGTAAAAQLPHLCRAKTSIKIHRQWGQELQLLHRVLATSQGGEGGKPGAHGARSRLCSLLQPPGPNPAHLIYTRADRDARALPKHKFRPD